MSGDHHTEYFRGKVISYDDRTGYGYISPEESESLEGKLLVHRKSLRNQTTYLQKDDRVLFGVKEVPRGLLATDVHLELEADNDLFMNDEICYGTIVKTVKEKNYGFIRTTNGFDIYFRFSDIEEDNNSINLGTPVSCKAKKTMKGLTARDISIDKNASSDQVCEITNRFIDLLPQAILARDNRNYNKAAKLYEQGLIECPSVQLITSYAAMEKNRNRKDSALKIYEKGIELFPQNAKLHEDAGILCASLGKYDRALSLLKIALKLFRKKDKSGEKNVLLHLGRTYSSIGTINDLKESIKYFNEAVKVFGNRSVPQYDLLALNVARIRTQHYRGNLTYNFLKSAGFKIVRAEPFLTVTIGADFVVEINNSEIVESYGISGNLLIRCLFKSIVERRDINELDARVREWGDSGLVDEQVCLFIISSLSDNLQKILFKRIDNRSKLSPAIVPIPQSIIETTDGPLNILRIVFDRWLYRRDLFSLNFPVVGRRFFGREKPLAELRDAITNSTPTGVFGLRKVGKTSLLKETERRSSESGDIAIYMDLLRVPNDISDTRWLYWKLATLLYEKWVNSNFSDIRWRLGGEFNDFFEIPENFPVATAFDADLTKILATLQNTSINPKPKIILLFDEIERLLPNSLGKEGFKGFFDFIGYLRGVSQETDDIVVIITGANAAIAEASQFNGRDNPVFNFFKEIYLQLLEPNECKLMIKSLGRGMGLRFNEDACNKIFSLTGGHPFFTRQLCSFIAMQITERPASISISKVRSFVDQYLEFSGKDYQEIIDRFSRDYPQERDLCLEIAKAGGSLLLKDIKSKEANLRHLVGYQIVSLDGNRVVLTIELLKKWLMGSAVNAI